MMFTIFSITTVLFSCNSAKKSSDKKENSKVTKDKAKFKMPNTYIVNELYGRKSLLKNPTITFDSNSINGNAGCNNYEGKTSIIGDRIKFEQVVSTKMYCEEFMQIETEFLEALSKATHFKIDESNFFLYNKSDDLLLVGKEKE